MKSERHVKNIPDNFTLNNELIRAEGAWYQEWYHVIIEKYQQKEISEVLK